MEDGPSRSSDLRRGRARLPVWQVLAPLQRNTCSKDNSLRSRDRGRGTPHPAERPSAQAGPGPKPHAPFTVQAGGSLELSNFGPQSSLCRRAPPGVAPGDTSNSAPIRYPRIPMVQWVTTVTSQTPGMSGLYSRT